MSWVVLVCVELSLEATRRYPSSLPLLVCAFPALCEALRWPPFSCGSSFAHRPDPRIIAAAGGHRLESCLVVGSLDRLDSDGADAGLACPLRADRGAGAGPVSVSRRLGFFGIETGTTRGGLHSCGAAWRSWSARIDALDHGTGSVCRCSRAAGHPQTGIGHLAHRITGAIIVPLAMEYPFWNDRCPEALVRFGSPIEVQSGRDRSVAEWTGS